MPEPGVMAKEEVGRFFIRVRQWPVILRNQETGNEHNENDRWKPTEIMATKAVYRNSLALGLVFSAVMVSMYTRVGTFIVARMCRRYAWMWFYLSVLVRRVFWLKKGRRTTPSGGAGRWAPYVRMARQDSERKSINDKRLSMRLKK